LTFSEILLFFIPPLATSCKIQSYFYLSNHNDAS
jgi:hypothetical protein